MDGFRSAHAPGADWRAAVAACVEKLGTLSPRHRLGFVYATDRFAGDLGAIAAGLSDATPVKDWVGTVGIGICATAREYFDEPALAVMVAAAEPEEYRLLPKLERDTRPLKNAHWQWMERAHPRVALVHADPRAETVPRVIAGLAEDVGFVVGGLTCSRQGFPQLAGGLSEGGVSGALFAGGVALATGLSQGCAPIGPTRHVTECAGSIVAEIDERPALEVLKEDLGEAAARELPRSALNVHAALPVPGSDTGDYLVRNLMGIDPQRGLIAVAAEMTQGDPILFVRRDRAAAEQDLGRMLRQLKARAKGAPKGGIYVSCVARGPGLFGEGSWETRKIQAELGQFPLVGFFANGEISHNRLYGYTGVLTLFL